MKPVQQELPLPRWGGARKGAGRKRKSPRKNVPHRKRRKFRRGTLHVTVRMRREVWNLRTHRCFRALERSFARGCERFGFRLIDFSVQGNHIHMIVEAPDVVALCRAIKGLAVRMARALNKVMSRRGPVFADRYHAAPAHLADRGIQGNPVRARELGGARGPGEQGAADGTGSVLFRMAARLRSAARRQSGVVAALRRRSAGSEAASAREGRVAAMRCSGRWRGDPAWCDLLTPSSPA